MQMITHPSSSKLNCTWGVGGGVEEVVGMKRWKDEGKGEGAGQGWMEEGRGSAPGPRL